MITLILIETKVVGCLHCYSEAYFILYILYLVLHQLLLSMEQHKWVSLNAPPHSEACFFSFDAGSSDHPKPNPTITGIGTRALMATSPALYP